MEYCKICKKNYLTYVCGSDRNIRPSVTRPWAVTRQASLWVGHLGTDIPVRTATYDRYTQHKKFSQYTKMIGLMY
jgi:hypothetical protein